MRIAGLPGLVARRSDVLLTLIGLSGIALPFLPFASDYVPMFSVEWRWPSYPNITLVLPCMVLPPLISLGYIVRLVTGRFPFWANAAGYALAAAVAAGFLAGQIKALDLPDPRGILVVGLFFVAFAVSVWLSRSAAEKRSEIPALILLQSVYVILMVFGLAIASFWGDLQIGAWLGVATLLAYLLQIALAVKQYRPVVLLAIPLALIFWNLGFADFA